MDNCGPVCKCIRAHCNCKFCKPTIVVFTSVYSVHPPADYVLNYKLHDCTCVD